MDTIVLLVFGILITLIVLYYVVNGYLEGTTRILYKTDLNQQQTVDVSSSPEYSYGMWINVKSLPTSEVTIIDRANELKLSIKNGKLILKRNNVTYEVLDYFPLQKMVYITITVENIIEKDKKRSFINAYIDGKMVKSYSASYITTQATEKNKVTIGTFDAKLFGFKRWKHALSPSAVSVEYEATNLQTIFGNYNVDISLLENDKLMKRFSVF